MTDEEANTSRRITWTPEQVARVRAQLAGLTTGSADAYALDSLALLAITLPSLLDEVAWLQEELAQMMLIAHANQEVAAEVMDAPTAAQAELRHAMALDTAGYPAEMRARGRLYQFPERKERLPQTGGHTA